MQVTHDSCQPSPRGEPDGEESAPHVVAQATASPLNACPRSSRTAALSTTEVPAAASFVFAVTRTLVGGPVSTETTACNGLPDEVEALTVHCVPPASGEAVSVVVEPFEPSESLGIEFKKELAGGTEFHSAKRQTSEQLWSLAELTRVAKSGRSVLSDLLSKLQRFTGCQVIFVSGTTARSTCHRCRTSRPRRPGRAARPRRRS